MKQMMDIKEESQQKLQDVVNTKTKELEKFKVELDTRIIHFEEELQKASVENSELSRSLHERSSLLMKAGEEKFQADSQIEMLKNDLYSCEKEISSIKYELNVISNELEIRNEEKNMCMKSAEAANKRHFEDVKRITKLEAECQRLRVLVRKKLPGPAALAQMKLEVESLGRKHGEDRLERSPAKGSSPQHFLNSEFTLESIQKLGKENEFLSSKLLALEEEMKILKETLSKRNSELQASRNICSKQGNKLHQMESRVLALIQQNGPPKPNFELHFGTEINLPCFVSTPKDGIDEERCSESSAAARISEHSYCNQEKLVHMINKGEKSNHLELMDDFLEMERLACLPIRSNGSINMSSNSKTSQIETAPFPCVNEVDHNQQKCIGSDSSTRSTEQLGITEKLLQLLKPKLRITSVIEANAHGADMMNIFYDIWNIVLDAHKELFKEAPDSIDDLAELNSGHTGMQESTGGGILLKPDDFRCTKSNSFLDQQMKAAISLILEFVLSLGKAVKEIQADSNYSEGLVQRIEEFSTFTHRVMSMEITLYDFILALSRILCETNDIGCRMWKTKGNEGHSNGPECIDKETLSENEMTQHEPTKDSFEAKNIPLTLSLENFEHIKLEKEKLEIDLSSCKEVLNQTNINLIETEQQLSALKSELASCRKSNSLAETQLKCMVESYRKLESLKEELEVQIDCLDAKAQSLVNELQVERCSHQENLAKYSELQEQMERNMKLSICSFPSNADDTNTQQDIDIAAAAVKLAECQETIFLLGKQLQAMRGQAETKDSLGHGYQIK
ncbi:hypothetical protein HPP92_020584 [Vanilla planifolia]|uniref:Filament-like plant protein 4 n=1 Tax=Vanilla planifolia TaxID=51239 RepID=A0A835Q3Y0_VANPL|nr:hypothetical protein HPP92_020584 [Vanilla planifolia]